MELEHLSRDTMRGYIKDLLKRIKELEGKMPRPRGRPKGYKVKKKPTNGRRKSPETEVQSEDTTVQDEE